MSRRVTIEDVARRAGVGKVTVSYVLNGRSKDARISEKTRLHVLQVANELSYRPNALARMLVTRRTDTFAVLFQSGTYFSVWSSFTSLVMRGITEAMVEEGCDLMLHTKPFKDALDEADSLMDGRVDGVLILRDEDDPTLIRLVERNFPCVQFFTHNDKLEVPWVDCDNILGGELAADHLIGMGHRKLAMMSGSPRSTSSNDRIRGFRNALTRAGIPVREEWILGEKDSLSDLIAKLKSDDPPTGIFIWSDDVAVNVIRELRDVGIKVPDDVSIVGFDSSSAAETSVPGLTSVHQPVHQMAAQAARMLVRVSRTEELAKPAVLVEPVLHVRESTGPPRREGR